jgi:hypothetical protein
MHCFRGPNDGSLTLRDGIAKGNIAPNDKEEKGVSKNLTLGPNTGKGKVSCGSPNTWMDGRTTTPNTVRPCTVASAEAVRAVGASCLKMNGGGGGPRNHTKKKEIQFGNSGVRPLLCLYFGDRPSPSVQANSRSSSLGRSAFLYVYTVSQGFVSALGSLTVTRSSSIPGDVKRMRSLIVMSSL